MCIKIPHSLNSKSFLVLLLIACVIKLQASDKEVTYLKCDSLLHTFDLLISDFSDSAYNNVVKALDINQEIKDSSIMAFGNYCLGQYYRIKGDNQQAIKLLKQALTIYSVNNQTRDIVLSMNELGMAHKNAGDFLASTEYYLDGIKISGDAYPNLVINLYINLSNVNRMTGNDSLSITDLTKCLTLNPEGVQKAIVLTNLANVYVARDEFDLAEKYYVQALNYYDSVTGYYYERNALQQNIANLYIKVGKVSDGIELLHQIKSYENKGGMQYDLIYVYLTLSEAFNTINQLDSAIYYTKKSIGLAKDTQSNKLLLIGYEYLSDLYEKDQQYKYQAENQALFIQLKDSLFDIDKQNYAAKLIAKYQNEKKESTILLLEADRILQQKKLDYQRQQNKVIKILIFVLIGIALFILFTAYYAYRFYKQKNVTQLLVVQRKEAAARQKMQGLLNSKELELLKARLLGQNKERNRISQELHDSIGGSIAAIRMNVALLNEQNTIPELQKTLVQVDNVYNEVRIISHDLANPKFSNYNFCTLLRVLVDDMTKSSKIENSTIFHNEEQIDALARDIKIDIYYVLQELMTNTLKHAKAKAIDIQIIIREKTLSLMYEDDGIGLDSTKNKTGIGLKNINTRIEKLNGIINIDSQLGEFTLIAIELPINNT